MTAALFKVTWPLCPTNRFPCYNFILIQDTMLRIESLFYCYFSTTLGISGKFFFADSIEMLICIDATLWEVACQATNVMLYKIGHHDEQVVFPLWRLYVWHQLTKNRLTCAKINPSLQYFHPRQKRLDRQPNHHKTSIWKLTISSKHLFL